MIEIKNRFTDEVIHSGDFRSVKECVEDAIKRKITLSGADLRWADFREADFRGADFRRVDFRDANFRGADFRGANLNCTNFRGADFRRAKNIIQWQSPEGEKRICISVKHESCVMHQLGCFWGNTDQAVTAIRKKYGENSLYEKLCFLNAHALEMGQ